MSLGSIARIQLAFSVKISLIQAFCLQLRLWGSCPDKQWQEKSHHGLGPAENCLLGAGRMRTLSAACFPAGRGGGGAGGVLQGPSWRESQCQRMAASSRAPARRAWQGKAPVGLSHLLLLVFRSKGLSSQIKRCPLLPPVKCVPLPDTSQTPFGLVSLDASRWETAWRGRDLRVSWAASASSAWVPRRGSGQGGHAALW